MIHVCKCVHILRGPLKGSHNFDQHAGPWDMSTVTDGCAASGSDDTVQMAQLHGTAAKFHPSGLADG